MAKVRTWLITLNNPLVDPRSFLECFFINFKATYVCG